MKKKRKKTCERSINDDGLKTLKPIKSRNNQLPRQ
jgi:hypothetical protein